MLSGLIGKKLGMTQVVDAGGRVQGQHQAVLDQLFRWEQEHLPTVTGYVGGYLLEPAVQALAAPFGILVIVVFDSQAAYTRHRDHPEQDHWEQHLQELLTWFAEGKLKPHISASYPLEQAAQALNDMMERKVMGKVVLVMG